MQNKSGTYTRKPLRPSDYIHFHQQQKMEGVRQRLEAQNQLKPQNTQQVPNVRKRQATTQLQPQQQQQQQQQPMYQTQHQQQQQALDPMITDTKQYLALKRRKQAFEDFLLVKRMEKEQSKSERKLSRLQKEFDLRQQKPPIQQQKPSSELVEMTKNQ